MTNTTLPNAPLISVASSLDVSAQFATPWGELPTAMRVLWIGTPDDKTSWLSEVFESDGACRVSLHQAAGIVEGLRRLRDEPFDAVLIGHDPPRFDALPVLDAIRTGSSESQPILVLSESPESDWGPHCLESGADAYLCLTSTTTRMLLWQVARARERHRLLEENRAFQIQRRQLLDREQNEAQRVLNQQRELVRQLRLRSPENDHVREIDSDDPQRSAVRHYRELLQTYIVMGAGNLSNEIERIVNLLTDHHLDALSALEIHVRVVDDMIRDLGNRSARHVTTRADLLLIEILLQLSNNDV